MFTDTPQKHKISFNILHSEKVLSAAILVAGTGLFWYGSWYGLNMTNDSFDYIRSGSFFSHGDWFMMTRLGQLSSWPPLFGYMIYLWSIKLGLNPVFMQFTILICNFFLLLKIGKKILEGTFERIIWLAASFTGVGFIMIHVFLWSESLFLAIQLSLIMGIDNFIITKKLNWLWFSVLLSVLLCLQRNAGIFIISAIALTVFMSVPGRRGLISAFILFLTGVMTFSAWNLFVSIPGEPAGFLKQDYFKGILLNLWNYGDVISAWFLPRMAGAMTRVFILLLFCTWLIFKNRDNLFRRFNNYSARVIGVIIVFYFTGISSLGRIDPWEAERYLSVIYPFILLVIIMLTTENENIGLKSFTRRIIIAFFGLWIIYTGARSMKNVIDWHAGSKAGSGWISNP